MSQTFADNLLPSATGLDLGSVAQAWDLFAQTITVAGASTLTGAVTFGAGVSGITTLSLSGQLTSTLVTGTAPFVVASTTQVSNLNVSQLVGATWVAPGTIGSTTPNTGAFTTISATGVITSTVSTGTAPFTIASTTKVTNLNADQVDGGDWANPVAIGTGTPAAATFTTCTGNTSVTIGSGGTAITQYKVYSQSLAPTQVSANTTSEQTFTVTGLSTSDKVWVNKPTHQAGLGIVNCRVSATNTLSITFMDNTASPITPTTETYQIVAVRS